jgi:hypothetical protein
MRKLVLTICLFLTACGIEVYPASVDTAVRYCEPHGGLQRLVAFFPDGSRSSPLTQDIKATCKDGVIIHTTVAPNLGK